MALQSLLGRVPIRNSRTGVDRGRTADRDRSDLTARTLRIASYNVRGCVGADRRRRPDRIARVLEEIDADIIGLQEVTASQRRPREPWKELAELTGYEAIAGPVRWSRGAAFGNAVLSRLPLERYELIDLSVPGREPRGAIDAELGVGGQRVRIVVTHFGLSRRERRIQAARIVERLAPCDADVSVLLGDFNEWLERSEMLRDVRSSLGIELAAPTFPAPLPLLALDRIWVRPGRAIASVRVHRSRLARFASDHLPVVATVRLPA